MIKDDMVTQQDVRLVALSLPETTEDANIFAFSVINKGKSKGITWVWLERIHPKKARVPNPSVIAVTVADLNEKSLLIGANLGKYFTEPHYNGYPAVLVRLDAVSLDEVRSLIVNAWCCQAPATLVEKFKAGTSRKPVKE